MKNLILLIIFILAFQVSNCQIKSGEIIYRVRITDNFNDFRDTTGLSDHLKNSI